MEGVRITVKEKEKKTCVQCLDDKNQEDMTELRCGHAIHKRCKENWFARSTTRTCPNCRVPNSDLTFTRNQEAFFRITHVPAFELEYKPVVKRSPALGLLGLAILCVSAYGSADENAPLVGVLVVWSVLTTMLRWREAKHRAASLKMIEAPTPFWLGSRINIDFGETILSYILASVLNVSMVATFVRAAYYSPAIQTPASFLVLATGFSAALESVWPCVRLSGELFCFGLFAVLNMLGLCITFDPTAWLVSAAKHFSWIL